MKAKLTANKVTIVSGEAQIIDKNTVRCGEETYEGENLISVSYTHLDVYKRQVRGIDIEEESENFFSIYLADKCAYN